MRRKRISRKRAQVVSLEGSVSIPQYLRKMGWYYEEGKLMQEELQRVVGKLATGINGLFA